MKHDLGHLAATPVSSICGEECNSSSGHITSSMRQVLYSVTTGMGSDYPANVHKCITLVEQILVFLENCNSCLKHSNVSKQNKVPFNKEKKNAVIT